MDKHAEFSWLAVLVDDERTNNEWSEFFTDLDLLIRVRTGASPVAR